MSISNAIQLLTGIALFLFGMSLMGDGLKRVAGNRMEMILYRLTENPVRGALFGTLITAVIQSSGATSVMAVGFVNSGIMKLSQAAPVIFGSMFGTSITGWIVCLSTIGTGGGLLELISTDTLTCIAAVTGVLLRMFSKKRIRIHTGDILLGFAILMFGMSAMSGSVSPLRNNPAFIDLMTGFTNPFVGIVFGILFTAILQSASASVGILQVLSLTGAIPFEAVFPLLIGIGIGAAVPVLISGVGASADGKRTALLYLVGSILSGLVLGFIFYLWNAISPFPFLDRIQTPVSIAAINTIYRFVTLLLLMPFSDPLVRLVKALVKEKNIPGAAQALLPLETRFFTFPEIAIEQSRLAANDMASRARENLFAAFSLLDTFSEEGFERIEKTEDVVDAYEDHLGTYLLKLAGQELTASEKESIGKFLHTITDFERISDHAMNLAENARELKEKGLLFSDDGKRELLVLRSAVSEIVGLAVDAFLQNDPAVAIKVEPLEETIDSLCTKLKDHHVERMSKGLCTLTTGFVFNDLLGNYERVADHCSNIALAVISTGSDSFDPHEYINNLSRMKDEAFEKAVLAYSEKYAV